MNQHFSRSEIDLESLRKIQNLFGNDGELDESGFVDAFGSILGDGLSRLQLSHLFMKIDANSDGSIDWDELLNFMFLDNQEHDSRENEEEEGVPQFFPANYDVFALNNEVKTYHRNAVASLIYIDKSNQLLTAGRDGCIRFWHPTTLVHQSAFTVGGHKDWISAVTFMSASNKLAVSSVNNGISFFDLAVETKKKVGHISMEQFDHAAPLCMGYCHDALGEKEMLLVGDDSGGARIYFQDDKIWTLGQETRRNSKSIVSEDIPMEEGYRREFSGFKMLYFKKHSDHITQIEYVPDLSAVVTCSLDATVVVYDIERGKVKRTFSQHEKAVYSFVWSSNFKIIASCGLERHIILWSPYSRRSVATLSGHTSSILKVAINDSHNQLMSLSNDNIVKVWDIRNHRCIQTISLMGQDAALLRHPGAKPVLATCLIYVKRNKTLVAASNKLKIYPIKERMNVLTRAHSQPVVSALYNKIFHQVISVDEVANLSIWNVDCGDQISKFKLRHIPLTRDQIDHASSKLAAAAAENTTLTAAAAGISTSDENNQSDPVDAVKAATDISQSANDSEDSTFFSKEECSVTAMCFDDGGRRMITGSHHATDLKIWNFSNGCLLKTLVKEPERTIETCGRTLACAEVLEVNRLKSIERRRKRREMERSSEKRLTISEMQGSSLEEDCAESAEVTKIAYVVNTLPRIPGHSTIKNKYIVSVGWDRRVYVWIDGASDSKEQGYYLRMPDNDDELDEGHTDDIMTISFIPPDIVATGGYDGRVVLWCLSSGKISRSFRNLGSAGIESSVYVARLSQLVASRSDGTAVSINIETGKITELSCFSKGSTCEPITAMCTDSSDDTLMSGDEKGEIRVWDIVGDRLCASFLCPVSSWKGHRAAITSLDYVQDNRLAETFVLSGCSDGVVAMWTLSGAPVGNFGQLDRWNLRDFKCFSADSFQEKLKVGQNTLTVEDVVRTIDTCTVQDQSRRDLSALTNQEKTTYKSFPNVGEVWLKVDTDLLKGVRKETQKEDDERCVHPKCVLELLTVTRQDEIRNEIKGWDGLSATKREKVVPIMEFLRGSESGLWIKEDELSERIGRIYYNPGEKNPYKVFYIHCSKSEKRWFAVDAAETRHSILRKGKTYLGLRAPKSISLYYLRKSILERLQDKLIAGKADSQFQKGEATDQETESTQASLKGAVGLKQGLSLKRSSMRRISTLRAKESKSKPSMLKKGSKMLTSQKKEHQQEDRGQVQQDDLDTNLTEAVVSEVSLFENSKTSQWLLASPPVSSSSTGREPSIRQRIPQLRARLNAPTDPCTKRDYRQRVHQIIDIPVDFGQLRATLSISNAVEKHTLKN